jgi:hypothetical protein
MLTSCGVKKSSVRPVISTTFAPVLNEIRDVEIGDALVSKEKGQKYDAIEITKEFKIKLDYTVETIEPGTIFINDYTTKNMDLYSHSSDSTFGIAIPSDGKNSMVYTSHDNDGIYTTGFSAFGFNFLKPNEKIEYIQTKVPAKDKEYFKQEFIYNGRVSDALKFIYREYVNDYARSAFTQDVQYDLSESDIIGFRGLRIKIINATNTTIEYIVLNYFEK